eukprot:scaffold50951_cov84-Phaeocystis_antarctica.AAC.5
MTSDTQKNCRLHCWFSEWRPTHGRVQATAGLAAAERLCRQPSLMADRAISTTADRAVPGANLKKRRDVESRPQK